ncbi:MAG: tetratricopeptide repeat protein [Candidatus Poribacteria bacterium]|nr:tetratricopeptide repeat protein [Candidatus Poribacteria bacterium]MDE0504975.1 tetratricopeptide repeat protein [Candidatus Poribacteria bacterium]
MRVQLPTIIVLCFAAVLAVTLVYYTRKDPEGTRESVNLQSAEFKMIRTHANDAYASKEYDKAISLYEDAITMRPENAEVLNDLGATYYAYGLAYAGPSWPSWETDLEGKTAAEGLDELQMAIAHTESGYIVMNSANRESTDAIEQKAEELGAIVYTETWEDQVTIRLLIGKTQQFLMKAEDAYRRSIDLKPTYSPAYHNLGSLLMKIGQTDSAVNYLREAHYLDPRNKKLEQYLTQFK